MGPEKYSDERPPSQACPVTTYMTAGGFCARSGPSQQNKHDSLVARCLHTPGVLRPESSSATTCPALPAGPPERHVQELPPKPDNLQFKLISSTLVLTFLNSVQSWQPPRCLHISTPLYPPFWSLETENSPLNKPLGVYLRELILVWYLQLLPPRCWCV